VYSAIGKPGTGISEITNQEYILTISNHDDGCVHRKEEENNFNYGI
jgi:hypothetical protein